MRIPPLNILFLSSLCFLSAAPLGRAQTYSEIFPNANASTSGTAGNLLFSSSGWMLYSGATAVDNSNNANAAVAPNVGKPADAQPVNSNPQNVGIANGLASNFVVSTLNTNNLYYTNEYSLTTTAGLTFSWYQGNQSATDVFRLALNVNGAWIASQTTFTNTAVTSGANFSGGTGGAELKMLALAGANFYPLTFTPGTALSINTADLPQPAPAGTITAFGLYSDNRSSTQRFDTFQIVPEPSTTMLATAGFGLFGLMMVRRRRLVAR